MEIGHLFSCCVFAPPASGLPTSLASGACDRWDQEATKISSKKCKRQRGALKELERAMAERDAGAKACGGPCVTMPRSLGERLHRKSYLGAGGARESHQAPPHVVYCRLWRWPDLSSHLELVPMSNCRSPYGLGAREVCINPYHYDRVKTPRMSPVRIPVGKLQSFPPGEIGASFSKVTTEKTVEQSALLGKSFSFDLSMPRNVTYPESFERPILSEVQKCKTDVESKLICGNRSNSGDRTGEEEGENFPAIDSGDGSRKDSAFDDDDEVTSISSEKLHLNADEKHDVDGICLTELRMLEPIRKRKLHSLQPVVLFDELKLK